MSVSIEISTESAELGGVRYYFCCAGCRRRFESDPDRYVEVNVQ
jgi:YHS domain-containing protein